MSAEFVLRSFWILVTCNSSTSGYSLSGRIILEVQSSVVINVKSRGISRRVCKLARTFTLINIIILEVLNGPEK